MIHQVTISDHVLEEMVLAASESFILGSAVTDRRAEVHGYLWGSRRTSGGEPDAIEYIHIDKFSVSSSAYGDEDIVSFDEKVARIKNSILDLWAPHYYFLGDFHTHPYATLKDVNKDEGWKFSEHDIKSFIKDDNSWGLSGSNSPIMMVMAVTEIGRVRDTVLDIEERNRLMFSVGNLRFWLSIGIGKKSERGKRRFSEDDIYFHPFSRYFNESGSRIEGR